MQGASLSRFLLPDGSNTMPVITAIKSEGRPGLSNESRCWHVGYQFCGLPAEVTVYAENEAEARDKAVWIAPHALRGVAGSSARRAGLVTTLIVTSRVESGKKLMGSDRKRRCYRTLRKMAFFVRRREGMSLFASAQGAKTLMPLTPTLLVLPLALCLDTQHAQIAHVLRSLIQINGLPQCL
jgi:hypothetical protein